MAEPLGNGPFIELVDVTKTFRGPSGELRALDRVSLAVERGRLGAIVGRSGSGKSTLLNMIAGIDRPTLGEVWVGGVPVHSLSEGALAAWRGQNVGVVFQFFQLLPTLTVLENVVLPMDFAGRLSARDRRRRAMELLERMGIADQARKLPLSLSGGQQQRAAIARALANDPSLLVADEPTGNLDSHTAEGIFHLFATLAREGKTVLVITHEKEIARQFEETITIADGVISDVSTNARGATVEIGRMVS